MIISLFTDWDIGLEYNSYGQTIEIIVWEIYQIFYLFISSFGGELFEFFVK